MPLLHYVENPNKIVLLLSKLKEELFNQKSLYIDKSSLLLTGIPIYMSHPNLIGKFWRNMPVKGCCKLAMWLKIDIEVS